MKRKIRNKIVHNKLLFLMVKNVFLVIYPDIGQKHKIYANHVN